jgi:hypothetical protein
VTWFLRALLLTYFVEKVFVALQQAV